MRLSFVEILRYDQFIKMANSKADVELIFPFEIKGADEEILKKYPDRKTNVFVGPKKYCFIGQYKNIASELYIFEARPDDVWLVGFPRSGTTLTSEIIWLLSNDLDYEKASEIKLESRFPVLENAMYFRKVFSRLQDQMDSYGENNAGMAEKLLKPAWETLKDTKEKRFIRTHLPLSLASPTILTKGCKVIYIARNPRDVCVSTYLLLTSAKEIRLDFDQFWDYFRNSLSFCTPYFEHVKEGWEASKSGKVLFLFYENYSKDLKGTIRTIAKFLEKEITEEDLDILTKHLNIENFRKNKSVNNDHLRKLGVLEDRNDTFIRKGVVGGNNEYFQGQIDQEIDKWIRGNLKETDLKFV